jgi:cell division transport system permease protein
MTNIHLRSALNHIKRSPFQALAAFFVLSVTFFVVTLLSVLIYSSERIIRHFETRPQIIAFLKDEVDVESVSQLQSRLKSDVKVKEVDYVSKEEALEIYKRATSDNPLLSELVSPSIFPASLELSLTDLTHAQGVIEEVKKEEIVDQVGFTASLEGEDSLSNVIERLRKITLYIRVGGGMFAAILVGASFLVLIVIIGMRMTTRRGEIEVLNLIGATSTFIRSPIILEAIVYAIGGVFLGWLFAFIVALYSTPALVSYFGEIPVLPKDTASLFALFGVILTGELVVGIALALVGSMLAVSRVRRK